MIAFAANSLLCRAALGEDLIDAAYLQAVCPSGELPRSREAFLASLEAGRGDIVARANELGYLVNLDTDLRLNKPELQIEIDRDRLCLCFSRQVFDRQLEQFATVLRVDFQFDL